MILLYFADFVCMVETNTRLSFSYKEAVPDDTFTVYSTDVHILQTSFLFYPQLQPENLPSVVHGHSLTSMATL